MPKASARAESLDDERGETLLPDVDVEGASDGELVETAAITWSNASLRERVVARFVAMGRRADPLIERAVGRPSLADDYRWSATAAVTAIAILERRATKEALSFLLALSKEEVWSTAAHARAALKRLGKKPAARPVEGPPRRQLDAALATGRAADRAMAIAHLTNHADLDLLPSFRDALLNGTTGVRVQAALSCGRLGDAVVFGLLLRRLAGRGAPPKFNPRGGALPADVADALAAWNGLAELGDVRAFGEAGRFERDARYVRLHFEHASGGSKMIDRHPAGTLVRRP